MMRQDLYEDLYLKEQEYWWHVGKRAIVYSLLDKYLPAQTSDGKQRRAMDLGCGTGLNLDYLAEYGDAVGLDSSEQALEFCQQRGHTRLCLADSLPFADNSFDIITALDVVEHIPDDLAVMREVRRVLKPNGLIIVSVPAYGRLWSYWDQILGHYRRYTTSSMRRLCRRAGLDALKVSYSNMAILAPATAGRWVKGLRYKPEETPRPEQMDSGQFTHQGPESDFMPVPGVVNKVMIGYYRAESRALRERNLPFGLSVVCVARKPGGQG